MNTIELKSSKDLKICCSFISFMRKEKIKTSLERNLTEMLWAYLEKNKKVCESCK